MTAADGEVYVTAETTDLGPATPETSRDHNGAASTNHDLMLRGPTQRNKRFKRNVPKQPPSPPACVATLLRPAA